jgi:hypothetical protein
MGEQNANIGWRAIIRLADLKPHHILRAQCDGCGHQRRLRLWQITASMRPSTYLTDIDKRLRCTRCGRRGGARVLVLVEDKDDV